MALDANDLALIKSMNGMTPYEQFKTQHIQAKGHTSGIAVTGLVTGIVGTVAGVTAWIFAPLYSNAKAQRAREAAIAAKEQAGIYAAANQRQLDQLTSLLGAERAERIAGDVTLTNTVNDTVSGSQQGTLTAQQAAELAASQATQQVMQQTFADAVTGRSSLNATPVQIYSAPQPCGCPGCGCNG